MFSAKYLVEILLLLMEVRNISLTYLRGAQATVFPEQIVSVYYNDTRLSLSSQKVEPQTTQITPFIW